MGLQEAVEWWEYSHNDAHKDMPSNLDKANCPFCHPELFKDMEGP